MSTNIHCPKCGSYQIYLVRHDCDWGSSNQMYRVNPEEFYDGEEEKEEYGDIEFYSCDKCLYEWF